MNKEYQTNKRRIRKKYALDYLGGKCVKCGVKEKLQFDHINPEEQLFRIAIGLNFKITKFKKELNKCQLLCIKCHWEKTRVDRNLNIITHGSVNYYINKRCRCNLCKSSWAIYFSLRRNESRKYL